MARVVGRNVWIALRALVRADMLIAALLLVAAPVYAGDVTLAWDPVTHASLAGYVIHYGPAAGNYPNSIDVGNVTTRTVTNLTEGATYHFAVAAYDSAHVEGGLSNDVVATIAYTVPVANFTASTVSGVAPLALNFIDQSTGSITTYAWTFGDGTTSTSRNPSKVYTNAGTYSVGLTVNGPGGSNVKTKPNYITVTSSVDTTPPSAPASLTGTATGSSSINVSWAAATDNVGVTGYRFERCQGASCTTFTQIATPTGTSFADTGLSPSTTYRYRVRASDAAGNLGAYSPIASATTAAGADTTPPSAPASLTGTATGSSSINVSWAAATDNVGVTGYRFERCQGASCTTFSQIATPTGTSFAHTGLSPSTTYRYRVRASDAAGNLGAYSPIASATTAAGADTTPPSAPASLTGTATGSSSINVSWAAATDNVGVTGYRFERCQGASCTTFTQIATPTGTSFAHTGLSPSTTYRYRVRASDAAGNLGAYSPIASATTAADTTPPSAPASLTGTATGSSSINVSWTAATDNVGVTGYRFERCQGASCTTFTQIATPTGTSFAHTGLSPSTTYRYRVRASDAAGNLGAYSPIASATTAAGADTTPPSAPASLTGTATGSSSINVSWAAATDNVGVTGYRFERCQGASCTTFTQIATPTGTSFAHTGLSPSTTYRYRVRASDAAGNLGAYSPIASATTAAGADTTPPSAPASLTGTATGSSSINVSWAAATDNVGVTGYRFERCQGASCTTFTQIATPTGTSFAHTGLSPSTTYRYRVRASDAAGNLGAYSPIASATTAADTTPPSAPASLTGTATGSSSINVSWTAATDNVGVTGYRFERCQGASCTTFTQIATPTGTSFAHTGLSPSTTYRYRVRASDAAGNLGAYSPIASATTAAGADTTPPSAPASLTGTATGSSSINVSWAAATDNVGVTGYRFERCQGASCTTFSQIATPTGTSFAHTGLSPSTTYRYRVRASDAAGNLGAYSPIASATTAAGADTTPPSAPASLTGTATGSSSINVSWAAATDNVGVTGYRFERCQGASCTTFTQIATPTGTSFAHTGLSPSTTYRYRVRASDAAGNLGAYSPIASATTAADTTPPSAPASLTGTATGSSSINVSWAAATDNVGVTGYRFERCQGASCTTFTQIATPTGTSFAHTGLSPSTTYRYRVRASDAAGNLGAYSPIASATTAADTTPPSAPASLTGTATGSSSINVSWTAATDNVGVTGYRFERCQGASCTTFTQIATPTGTSFAHTGLSPSTTYRYRVRASDAAGNLGAYSPIASATTAVGATSNPVPIAYVQNNYATPQSPQTSVSVTYKSPQTAGNLNVVVVGWNDTNAAVNSVTDSKGNVYTRAVGPTMYSTQLSQSIYYAKNVAAAAANSNVVTVQFSAPAVYADIRVVEYAGIDRINPVDVVAVGSGSGTMSATSSVNTTHAKDLIFAANTVRTITTGPGSGFTSRVITSPDGDIVQDRSVTSTGSYSASAPTTGGGWVMQLVAFRGM